MTCPQDDKGEGSDLVTIISLTSLQPSKRTPRALYLQHMISPGDCALLRPCENKFSRLLEEDAQLLPPCLLRL